MIVDDDVDVREALADVLRDFGHEPQEAADGRAALRALKGGARPDVILLDWMMPGMDGPTFRAEQLADPELATIPVVLLTADARFDSKGGQMQVAAALSKPVNLEALLATIERLSTR